MARPIQYGEEHRRRVIGGAAQAIADGGPENLSLRALAAQAGISTTAIYTMVGHKSDVVRAVTMEAVASFTASQEDVPDAPDPLDTLRELGWAYRKWALEHPALYHVMFDGRVEMLVEGRPALAPLIRAVGRLHEAGRLRTGDPQAAVAAIWGSVHGAVSLELAVYRDEPVASQEARYEALLGGLSRGWALPVQD